MLLILWGKIFVTGVFGGGWNLRGLAGERGVGRPVLQQSTSGLPNVWECCHCTPSLYSVTRAA